MNQYFFAFLTVVASVPLLWITCAVAWSLLMDAIDRQLDKDDYAYGLATLGLWVVIGYANYHALPVLFGGAA